MARPNKKLFVSNTAVATASNPIGASGNSSQKLNQGFPTGDVLLHSLKLRHSGNLNLTSTGDGTIITRGGLQNIRGLWLQTPQHGIIVNGLSGLDLHVVDYYNNGVRAVNEDISSAATGTPTFDYHIPLDFRDRHAARPEDTSLDMFRVSYVELMLNYGGATDFISGGTYSTETLQVANLEIMANVDPGQVLAADVPAMKPYLDVLNIPINQTQTGFQVIMPYGGRLVADYIIQQKNGSTLAPVNNTIVGANDTDRLSFLVGGYAWANRIEWLALQDENVSEYSLMDGAQVGAAAVSWASKDSAGYRLSTMLGLNNAQGASPQTEFNIDVTSVSNGQLRIITKARVPIPADAERPKAGTP